MAWLRVERWFMGAIALVIMGVGPADAADSTEGTDKRALERIEETARRVGKNIEEDVTKTIEKIKEQHLAEKVEAKVKDVVGKTIEEVEKAGKKIESKFRD